MDICEFIVSLEQKKKKQLLQVLKKVCETLENEIKEEKTMGISSQTLPGADPPPPPPNKSVG